MDTAFHHRKIELQSPEDFAYLVNNVRRAAAESVAAAFPPVDGDDGDANDDDDLHARVEGLVEEYIRRTFSLAAPNLTINGLAVEPSLFFDKDDDAGVAATTTGGGAAAEPDVEPFDTRRRQRVEDLAREEEDLLRVLAQLKRQVPAKAVAARAAAVSGALAADEGAAAAATEAVAAAAVAASVGEGGLFRGDEDSKAPSPPPSLAETAASYGTAVGALVRLKQEMPATVARMERAREAGAYARAEG